MSPLSSFFFVVCQVPAGGRSCNTTQNKTKKIFTEIEWHPRPKLSLFSLIMTVGVLFMNLNLCLIRLLILLSQSFSRSGSQGVTGNWCVQFRLIVSSTPRQVKGSFCSIKCACCPWTSILLEGCVLRCFFGSFPHTPVLAAPCRIPDTFVLLPETCRAAQSEYLVSLSA